MADWASMAQAESTSEPRKRSWAALAAKLAAIIAGLAVLIVLGKTLGSYVPQFASWVESLGFWGPVAYVLGYAVATVAFIPGSLMTLAAGAIFGLAKGTVVVFTGATIGSALAFLISRYIARSAIERRIEGNLKFSAVDRAVASEGSKIVFLLRLSPVFPFNLLNYSLGLTSVRFRDYLAASVGMIPGSFLYVYYGKALGSLAAVAGGGDVERGLGYWSVLILGLVATAVVTALVTKVARKALRLEVENG